MENGRDLRYHMFIPLTFFLHKVGDPVNYHQNDALAKQHGKLLVDFANAEDTDEACLSFLSNIPTLFSATHKAVDQIKKTFPLLGSGSGLPGGSDQELLELLLEKKRLIAELNERFSEINYAIDDYDPLKSTLSLMSLDWERGAVDPLQEGETLDTENFDNGGFLQTFKMLGLSIVDGPVTIKIDAIKEEVETRMGANTLAQINQLARVGHTISELMTGADKERFNDLNTISEESQKIIKLHKKIENIQTECKKLLNPVIAGHSLNQNPALSHFLAIYNDMQINRITIGDNDGLIQVLPINENIFLDVKEIGDWYDVLLHTLAYCVVGFFESRRAKKNLRNCLQCEKYFIAKQGNQKFCVAACRLVWHKNKAV